jgi:hypothetical protein
MGSGQLFLAVNFMGQEGRAILALDIFLSKEGRSFCACSMALGNKRHSLIANGRHVKTNVAKW